MGTRYTDFTTASKWLFKDTCKFVNINVSEFQALKMDACLLYTSLAYIEDCRTEKYFKKEALAQMVTRNQAEPSIYEFLAVELFARQFDVS